MSIKEWFQSWWWPSRIRRLHRQVGYLCGRESYLMVLCSERLEACQAAEAEAKRMREKWLTATRDLEHAKEQAVQQKTERRRIYEQRDECRRLLMAAMGKDNVPEWVVNPYADMEARMKSGNA